MIYLSIKTLHISCAVISIVGFAIRGLLKLNNSKHLQQRWLQILPHCVDTILLSSAVYLAITSRQYPFVQYWLSAKVIALLCYILLGMMVMKWARSQPQRWVAYLLALCSAGYIISVALNRSPMPWG